MIAGTCWPKFGSCPSPRQNAKDTRSAFEQGDGDERIPTLLGQQDVRLALSTFDHAGRTQSQLPAFGVYNLLCGKERMKIDMAATLGSLILLLAMACMTKGANRHALQIYAVCRWLSDLGTPQLSCQLVVNVYIEMEPIFAAQDLSRYRSPWDFWPLR